MLLKISLFPRFHKVTPRVIEHVGLDDIHPLDLCFLVLHSLGCFVTIVKNNANIVIFPVIQKVFWKLLDFCLHKSRKSLKFAPVIELERHIETLLLSSDCVVVPDFGGFMAHHIEAHYDEADGTFIPPRRTLGFNPKLKINDSLLVHSYIEVYDLSYPEAMSRIEEEVAQLRQELSTHGFYEFHGIGTLSINAEGNMDFTPCEAGVLTPELYGLCSFEMKPIKVEHIEQLPLPLEEEVISHPQTQSESIELENDNDVMSVAPVLSIDETDEEQETKTISIRVAWLRNAVAVAAAVLAFFLITTPVSNSIDNSATISSVSLATIADTQIAKPKVESSRITTSSPKVDTKNSSSNVETSKFAVSSNIEQSTLNVQPSVQHSYVVVLASHVARANAETFVKQLHQQGHTEARIIERKGIVCVVYGNYGTQGEAYKAANKLHSNKELKQAWVMELKN